jgi:hypothetical protein
MTVLERRGRWFHGLCIGNEVSDRGGSVEKPAVLVMGNSWSKCGVCWRRADPDEKGCVLEGGCGVIWTHITLDLPVPRKVKLARRIRPDLEPYDMVDLTMDDVVRFERVEVIDGRITAVPFDETEQPILSALLARRRYSEHMTSDYPPFTHLIGALGAEPDVPSGRKYLIQSRARTEQLKWESPE